MTEKEIRRETREDLLELLFETCLNYSKKFASRPTKERAAAISEIFKIATEICEKAINE